MFIILSLFLLHNANAATAPDYKSIFGKRDACFIVSNLSTGKIIAEYNPARCQERNPPCSTLKPVVAMMAFEKGLLKDETSIIKWNGTHYDREELNHDQTPVSWMQISVNWANDWVISKLGKLTVQKMINDLDYGNHDFSEGEEFTVKTAKLKISPEEQIHFFEKLWLGKLPISNRTTDLTKKILFIEKLGNETEFSGKTGSCYVEKKCDHEACEQLGWFVGALKNSLHQYIFVTNFTDLEPTRGYAGGTAREMSKTILEKLGFVK